MALSNKRITLVNTADVGNENEAIRQSLEYFGFLVYTRHIGRPADFLAILAGEDLIANLSNYWIFSSHGDEGAFLLPELSPELYLPDEPQEPFSEKHVRKYAKLKNQIVLSTGCTLGQAALGQAFLNCKARAYIGSLNYVEGDAALLFTIRYFYEIANGAEDVNAFHIARNMNEETRSFERYYQI